MDKKRIEVSELDWSKSLRIPDHHIPDEEDEYFDLNELNELDEWEDSDFSRNESRDND